MPVAVEAARFNFGAAYLVSTLTQADSPVLLKVVPKPKQWTTAPERYAGNYVDAGLAHCLVAGKVPKEYTGLLVGYIQTLPDQELVFNTYQNYIDAIVAVRKKDRAAFLACVAKGEELYEERADASHGSFDDWEGGGQMNSTTIDLRLSAIIHTAASTDRDLYQSVTSIHKVNI